jgi:hypothetical protein
MVVLNLLITLSYKIYLIYLKIEARVFNWYRLKTRRIFINKNKKKYSKTYELID